jgi:nicotinamide mononucleotide (NMN) deamidase PncC
VDGALLEANSILSAQVAEAMATAARQTLGTEVGLALCAASRKDTFPDKPAGQIIMAVDLLGTVRSAELNYRSNPSEIKRLGSVFGLNLLRRMLLK